MKKALFLWVLIAAIFLLSACDPVDISGLENYDPANCSVSLSHFLFPGEDFLDKFEYTCGTYEYHDPDTPDGSVTAIAALEYSPDVYEQAKSYCLEQFILCESHQYIVGEYSFCEQLCHKIKTDDGTLSVGCAFPKHFNMFAYNDRTLTLVFLGFYNADADSPESLLAQENFKAFLDTVYSNHYDFSPDNSSTP